MNRFFTFFNDLILFLIAFFNLIWKKFEFFFEIYGRNGGENKLKISGIFLFHYNFSINVIIPNYLRYHSNKKKISI